MKPQFQFIPIAKIVEAENYRKTFDEDTLQELAESIKQQGVLEPILVRPAGSTGKESWELVFGARRLRAAKLAGLQEIPSIIRLLTDEEVFEIQITENLQRQDVHPMEEAEGYQKMLSTGKYDMEAISHKFGKSLSYIHQRLKFNDLIDRYKDMFRKSEIIITHAVELCRLTEDDQKRCLDFIYRKDWETNKKQIQAPAELRTFIQKEIALLLDMSPFKKNDEALIKEAGSCTNCAKRSGFNKTLFNDIQDKDRCFDSSCYNKKMEAHIEQKKRELTEAGETVHLVSSSNWMDNKDKKRFPDILINYDHYKHIDSKKEMCESAVKGLIIHGSDLGKVINICIDKKCPDHWKRISHSGSPVTPKEVYNQKIKRGVELDKEKVHKRIVEELGALPSYTKRTLEPLNKSETVGMLYLIFDSLRFQADEILEEIGWMKSNDSRDPEEVFFKKIKTCTQEEKAFIIRRAVFNKFKGSLPNSYYDIDIPVTVIREMALERKVPIDLFEEEQLEIRKKREARAKEKLDLQIKEEKESKKEVNQKKESARQEKLKKATAVAGNVEGPAKHGRGLSALLENTIDQGTVKKKKGAAK